MPTGSGLGNTSGSPGPAAPPPGPAAPTPGPAALTPAAPIPGPAAPAPGPATHAPGPAAPAPGPSASACRPATSASGPASGSEASPPSASYWPVPPSFGDSLSSSAAGPTRDEFMNYRLNMLESSFIQSQRTSLLESRMTECNFKLDLPSLSDYHSSPLYVPKPYLQTNPVSSTPFFSSRLMPKTMCSPQVCC
jgi:hypothetical protein